MMAAEGPYLAAIIARLPEPTVNLAAFGVAFAFAIIIESPVFMLMSASTALVEDEPSYRALRRFAYRLAALVTAAQVVLLLPPVFDAVAGLLASPGRRGAPDVRRSRAPAALARSHRLSPVPAGDPDPARPDPPRRDRDRDPPRSPCP